MVKIENKTVIKYRTVYKTLGVKEAARQTQLMPLQTWATSDGQLATDGSFYEIQASSSSWVYYSDLLIIVLIVLIFILGEMVLNPYFLTTVLFILVHNRSNIHT